MSHAMRSHGAMDTAYSRALAVVGDEPEPKEQRTANAG